MIAELEYKHSAPPYLTSNTLQRYAHTLELLASCIRLLAHKLITTHNWPRVSLTSSVYPFVKVMLWNSTVEFNMINIWVSLWPSKTLPVELEMTRSDTSEMLIVLLKYISDVTSTVVWLPIAATNSTKESAMVRVAVWRGVSVLLQGVSAMLRERYESGCIADGKLQSNPIAARSCSALWPSRLIGLPNWGMGILYINFDSWIITPNWGIIRINSDGWIIIWGMGSIHINAERIMCV